MSTGTRVRTEAEKQDLNKRLETVGWGVFLIMLGGLWLVPEATVPKGLWGIGVGIILLGLNAARRYLGIPMSTGTIVLGVIALASGIGDMAGIQLPLIEILIIVAGLNMLWKALRQKE